MSASISCVLPVYNGERFVAEALDSVFNQTLKPEQVIVVDDGSTDGTADVLNGYSSRITHVRQANAGPGAARNRGIRNATGELLSFIDADDVWRPEKLERQAEVLARNPDTGYCITFLQNFWTDDLAQERERLRDHDFSKPMVGHVFQCLLARRTAFERVGQIDERKRIGEDVDWFMRADNAGIVKAVIDEVLVDRRVHGANISYEVYVSQRAKHDLVDTIANRLAQQRAQTRSFAFAQSPAKEEKP